MKKILVALFILVSVTSGFAATWTVTTSGFTFSPDSITITQGDTVTFVLGGGHNAQEESQTDWNSNIAGTVTGFQTAYGVTENVTGLSVGTHYYVCGNHAGSGMKGRIFVQPAPPTVGFVVTSSSRSEGVGSFGIAVSITNPNANPTSVDVNVMGGGSATQGVDYTYSPITITFPANSQIAQIVTINVTDDQLAEGNENFTFQLAFPTNGASLGTNSQHLVTIVDNDTLKVSFATPAISQFENIGQINVPVLMTKKSAGPTSVTLHLNTVGSTATQGSDFAFNDTTITWPANTTGVILVPLNVVDDAIVEPDETVRLQLLNPTNGAVLLNDTFQLVIENNDTQSVPAATIRFVSIADSVTEFTGTVAAVVEVNNPSNVPVSFIVARNDAASTANVVLDYTFQNAPLTNGVGVSYDTVYYHVIDDQLIEPTETAVLHLLPVSSNALIGTDSVYTLSILDNDTLTFSFNGAGYSYVEDTDLVQIRVTISSPVDTATTVRVTLATGNAVNGVDFTFNDTTITFPANSIDTQSVWVRIINDTVVEPNEQVNFNLVNLVSGAHLGILAYTLTIIDNDAPSAIEETELAATVKIYPNPVTGTLLIKTDNEWRNVVVTDVLGKEVMHIQDLTAGSNAVDVSSLSAGMYYVTVSAGQKIFTKRFVKQD